MAYDNVLYFYRLGDTDSQNLAEYYIRSHQLEESQAIGISCSDSQILTSYAEFQSEVEDNIFASLYSGINILVLDYKIPVGFYDGDDLITSTSRLSRINFPYSKKELNPLYDRKMFKNYDSSDAEYYSEDSTFALIVSQIMGRNYNEAKSMIDNALAISNQSKINGNIYLNPYLGNESVYFTDYQNIILETDRDIISYMGLNTKKPYTPSSLTSISQFSSFDGDDSIYWGGGIKDISSDVFKEAVVNRYFLYNADTGFYNDNITKKYTIDDDGWFSAALDAGYSAFATQWTDPQDGFLNPIPFFDAVFNGSTLGEALIFSQKYFNWSIAVFADPLLYINPKINKFYYSYIGLMNTYWNDISSNISSEIASHIAKEAEAVENLHTIVAYSDLDFALASLSLAYNETIISSSSVREGLFKNQIKQLFDYSLKIQSFLNVSTEEKTLNNFLTSSGNRISRILLGTYGAAKTDGIYYVNNEAISEENIFPVSEDEVSGYWDLEFIFSAEGDEPTSYHFTIEIFDWEEYTGISLLTIKSDESPSQEDNEGWFVENNKIQEFEHYTRIPLTGISWNYNNKTIKYKSTSGQYLKRQHKYNFRITPRWTIGITEHSGTPINIYQIVYS